jgi:hypothetical protein
MIIQALGDIQEMKREGVDQTPRHGLEQLGQAVAVSQWKVVELCLVH